VNNLLSEVRQAQGVLGLARPEGLTDDLRNPEGHSATDAVTLGSGSWVIVVYSVNVRLLVHESEWVRVLLEVFATFAAAGGEGNRSLKGVLAAHFLG
jgi:hypothetical protein